ncbi:hypothetical protein OAR00_00970 [Alphaproteobacteria bacterium]|nr:hypothetical protein [Alphaproteobacteria bacterium]MDC1023105.1 hypothetical protein [Alphaproteobacteria bacterium]
MKVIVSRYGSIFGKSIANNKTSKFHPPMVRGLGIFYAIILIISHLYNGSLFGFVEIVIITLSTLIGFWDDKYNLSYKYKLLYFLALGVVFSFLTTSFSSEDLYLVYTLISKIFLFIFLILFFNQIDGINGLATGTFCTCLVFLTLINIDLTLCVPVIATILAYLGINFRGNIGIQGDSGSFFMGSYIAVLYSKSLMPFEYGLVLFILTPIFFDISSTTIIRFCSQIDLSKGHRNNLYQKLTYKLKNHVLVTCLFVFFQLVLCFTLAFLMNKFVLMEVYAVFGLISILLLPLFLFISYLIQNNKIFK